MGINVSDLIELIIRPSLVGLGINSYSAEQLMAGTCAQESHLGFYLKQQSGPALGIFQIEPNTHNDIHNNYIRFNQDLALKMYKLCGMYNHNIGRIPYDENLISNLKYATCIARIKYLRISEKLPAINDTQGQAEYWKKFYNTYQGRGEISDYLLNYDKYIKPYYT